MAQPANRRLATEQYVTDKVATGGGSGGPAVDASSTVKGVVQLAGDLGGTAAAPTVPALATKVNSSTYTAGLAGKQDKATLGADVAADATVRGALVASGSGPLKLSSQSAAPTGAAVGDVWVPSTPLTPADIGAQALSLKDQPNGYAGLGADGLIPRARMTPNRGVFRSGNYYHLGPAGGAGTGSTGTGTLRVHPIIVPTATTISRMFTEVTAAGEAGSLVRLAIYADDGAGLPGALVLDAGTINGAAGGVQEVTVNQALAAGIYWVGTVTQNVVTTQPTMRTVSGITEFPVTAGTSLPAANNAVFAVNMTGVTGALPGAFVYGSSSSFTGRVGIKVA